MRFTLPSLKGSAAGEKLAPAEAIQIGALAAISCLALFSLLVMADPRCAPLPDDGLSAKEHAQASRLHEIVRRSQGKWQSLSESDRRYLIDEISYGDEKSAKYLFAASTRPSVPTPARRSPPRQESAGKR